MPNFNEDVRERFAGTSIHDADVEPQGDAALVFADVLSDEIVDQVIWTLGDLRSCRDECKAQKRRKRGETNL